MQRADEEVRLHKQRQFRLEQRKRKRKVSILEGEQGTTVFRSLFVTALSPAPCFKTSRKMAPVVPCRHRPAARHALCVTTLGPSAPHFSPTGPVHPATDQQLRTSVNCACIKKKILSRMANVRSARTEARKRGIAQEPS